MRSRYYYNEARRLAFKGLAILSIAIAASIWLVVILPLASGIPIGIIALLAATWPTIRSWSEAGRMYQMADDAWYKEKIIYFDETKEHTKP